jgi:hypothetical protein
MKINVELLLHPAVYSSLKETLRKEGKSGYKRLAKLFHPNSPTGSHKAFLILTNAWESVQAEK